uniref:TSA: Wollemia nobilis Ref_Wollemi_Transcript_11895_1529 transcribed RNA sequence n=1 Tax=Wollemia nobilis TaxID=56998 RepID=A0A0C9RLV0_9CONI
MEFFKNAKTVRLRSHHDKYLWAEEDEETVSQDRDGASRNARWQVEFIEGSPQIRLKSRYNLYLTGTQIPFLLGMTGKKVLQTMPSKLDSSVEWEPIRDGFHVKLKTRYGNYLRANGGPPPWRNKVTHDIPHRTATQDWIFWEIEVMEITVGPTSPVPTPVAGPTSASPISAGPTSAGPISAGPTSASPISAGPTSAGPISAGPTSAGKESDPLSPVPHPKPDGRLIYYAIGDDNGDVEDGYEWPSFLFKGNGLQELTKKLEEETDLHDIIVCAHHPLTGNLYPLRLKLPPNNASMHLVLVKASSYLARNFA